jgi:hypothetical protein
LSINVVEERWRDCDVYRNSSIPLDSAVHFVTSMLTNV